MPSLKGTQTEKNILTAFAGESQARNKYTYFASVAKKEGYVLIADIFMETADQEKEHAKRLFKFLEGGDAQITATFPTGVIGDTAANLEAAAAGENEEWSDMYPKFAAIAREEGFPQIAAVMENIAVAEKQHEKQYRDLWKHVTEGTMFKRGEIVIWRCRNCGFICEGTQAPMACPACNHPQAHFEVLQANY
ncbi:Rubrerythrin [Anaerobiospirillum thomasii]|uniref:rubrerythrin n=1 Tax=Anaerobiospirillum thomasii TaxID=179995 RepID=UPI000D873EBA|nr:rubrerythrin family protein [Anaerobiospirillum thomasii]SPT67829.1 Rubrerythrin [Anaerobiospirillum thomasii]